VIRPFGEHALLVELDGPEAAQALAASLLQDRPAGVAAVVPGLASLLVELVPSAAAGTPAIGAEIEGRLRASDVAPAPGRARVIPVVYGGDHGPDLDAVAERCGLPPAELVARHAATELRVLFCGFAPGFAYLGQLPEELRVPRLATPRATTPPGSVAIAGTLTGIYPADLPGGWRIIGRTPIMLFDPHREPPTYLAPGDTVRFEPIAAGNWPSAPSAPIDW
jgi:KipI family sensor histidine kinase inhibitor